MEIRTLERFEQANKILGSFIHDGTIYVICGNGFEIELSKEEINYRAQLFVDYNENK